MTTDDHHPAPPMTATGTPPTFTLGQLVRASGLARASILNYEALGLLLPQARSPAGYRLYGPAELERLQRIRRFRAAGLPLAAIRSLMPAAAPAAPAIARPAELLQARLVELNDDVARLRLQQMQLAQLLAMPEFREAGATCRTQADWVALLNTAGFSRDDMRRWHVQFEADNPAAHTRFLQALGLSAGEVEAIRAASRPANQA